MSRPLPSETPERSIGPDARSVFLWGPVFPAGLAEGPALRVPSARTDLGLHVCVVVALQQEGGRLGVILPGRNVQGGQPHLALGVVLQQDGHSLVVSLLKRHGQGCEAILGRWNGVPELRQRGSQRRSDQNPPLATAGLAASAAGVSALLASHASKSSLWGRDSALHSQGLLLGAHIFTDGASSHCTTPAPVETMSAFG